MQHESGEKPNSLGPDRSDLNVFFTYLFFDEGIRASENTKKKSILMEGENDYMA